MAKKRKEKRGTMRRIILSLALAMSLPLLTARPSSGADDVMTFRGLRFGVDVREQIPECKKDCELTDPVSGYCFGSLLPKQTCWQAATKKDPEPSKVQFFDDLTDSLDLSEGLVNQLGGKLSALRVFFEASIFPQLETLFRTKYGEPTAVQATPGQSEGGGRIETRLRVWDLKDLYVELSAPAGEQDRGWATILTQEARRKTPEK
jgi:hypothetical protein